MPLTIHSSLRNLPVPLPVGTIWRWFAALSLVVLLTMAKAPAAKFFVAPDGDDTNPGTKERPFASLQRAQQATTPGDSVFIRGGLYQMKDSDIARRDSFLATVIHLDKSGFEGRPISYLAWSGERPVFDCSQVKPPGLRISAFRVRASWLIIKGLEVTGVQVTATGHTQSICFDCINTHDADIPGRGHIILNNLAHGSSHAFRNLDPTASRHAGNSFDPSRKPTDTDFLNLDEAALIAPRQANGELPVIGFLHLVKGSPLIDSGVPAEQPYSGKAPDPGAFEHP